MILNEKEKTEKFIRKVGLERADRLQEIMNNSYPRTIWNFGWRELSTEDVFREKAKREGFTDKEIDMFLELCE